MAIVRFGFEIPYAGFEAGLVGDLLEGFVANGGLS